MPTYRVKFRGTTEEQVIKADGMGDSGTSYVFYDTQQNVVAQIPKEVVLVVIDDDADGGTE